MAMTMTGEIQLAAPRQTVWEKLNDPEVLKATIPGCESLEKTSDTSFSAVAVTKIGPVKARWKGKVTLTDIDPPNGYRINGEGEGGVAGFAKGGADVKLADKDGGTLLTYNVEAQIGGKLAQLGQRLINGAAKKMADEFFQKFAAAVSRRRVIVSGCRPAASGSRKYCRHSDRWTVPRTTGSRSARRRSRAEARQRSPATGRTSKGRACRGRPRRALQARPSSGPVCIGNLPLAAQPPGLTVVPGGRGQTNI